MVVMTLQPESNGSTPYQINSVFINKLVLDMKDSLHNTLNTNCCLSLIFRYFQCLISFLQRPESLEKLQQACHENWLLIFLIFQ